MFSVVFIECEIPNRWRVSCIFSGERKYFAFNKNKDEYYWSHQVADSIRFFSWKEAFDEACIYKFVEDGPVIIKLGDWYAKHRKA